MLFVFEKFVCEFLNAEEYEGRDKEDVGEVDGELAHRLVGAECLDIPHVVPGVIGGRGPGAALTILGAQRAEQGRRVEDGRGGDDETEHDQAVDNVIPEMFKAD